MSIRTIFIKVVPNASVNSVEEAEGAWKVRVKAVPAKGEANQEVINVLSDHLNISKDKIRIASGHKSRLKKIEIQS